MSRRVSEALVSLVAGAWQTIDGAMSGAGLGGLSLPAKVVAVLVLVSGAVFATVVFLADLLSDHPSSTGVLVFFYVGVCVAGAVALIGGIDWTLRRAIRHPD